MKKNLFSLLVAGALTTVSFVACNDTKTDETKTDTTTMVKEEPMKPMEEKGVMVGGANMVPSKDIVDNAAGSADHTTLVAAVKAAGLIETLKSAGPFTVFAPTNAAFAALPAGTVDNLLKAENKATLAKILTYHVVAGALKSTDLKDGQKLKTVQGEELTISYKDNKWMVHDAKGGMANIRSESVV